MAITFVSSTGTTIATAASTWSGSIGAGVLGGGNAIFVGLGPASSVVTISTVTDSAGNLYQLAVRHVTPRPAASAELWYATNISSASTRIFVTLSGASSGAFTYAQFAGVSTANALSVTGSSAITANSTAHGASQITPPTANQVVLSFSRLTASSIGSITNLGGMTTWITTNAAVRTHGMYVIQGAATTCTGSYTTSSNAQHASVIAAFSDTAVVVPYAGPPPALMLGYGA